MAEHEPLLMHSAHTGALSVSTLSTGDVQTDGQLGLVKQTSLQWRVNCPDIYHFDVNRTSHDEHHSPYFC